jgi:mycothiol synthase
MTDSPTSAIRNEPVLRAPRHEDVERILAFLHLRERALYRNAVTTEADLRWVWRMPGFDLARDAWLASDAAGEIVGYAAVGTRGDGATFDANVEIHPTFQTGEIGPRLLSLVEARARDLVRGEGGELGVWAPASDRASCERLERAGYRVMRTFYFMEIELGDEPPALAMPPGLEMRTFRKGPDDAALHQALQEAFAHHFRFVPEPLDEWIERRTTIGTFDPSLWLLAWEHDQVAGASLNFPDPDRGYVGALGVREAWRRRGLGHALLIASFQAIHARGYRRVGLSVDAENQDGATRLYERAGMSVTRRTNMYAKRVQRAS